MRIYHAKACLQANPDLRPIPVPACQPADMQNRKRAEKGVTAIGLFSEDTASMALHDQPALLQLPNAVLHALPG